MRATTEFRGNGEVEVRFDGVGQGRHGMRRGTHRGLVGKLKETDHLEDLVVDVSIVCRRISKEWYRRVRTGLASLRTLLNAVCLGSANGDSRFHKMREGSLMAEERMSLQERLCLTTFVG